LRSKTDVAAGILPAVSGGILPPGYKTEPASFNIQHRTPEVKGKGAGWLACRFGCHLPSTTFHPSPVTRHFAPFEVDSPLRKSYSQAHGKGQMNFHG
jgi:hypothetical protein